MITETTKTTDALAADEVFFDGECPMCSNLAAHYARMAERGQAEMTPLQTPGAVERAGSTPDAMRELMHVRTADGRVLIGADATLHLVRRLRFGRLLAAPFRLPGAMPIARIAYGWIARNRLRISAALARVRKP